MNKNLKNNLAKTLSEIKDLQVAKDFLTNILTPSELDELAIRLEILKKLKSGTPQREIAEKLKVSIGTVSRGSREVKYSNSKFIKSL